MTGAGVGQCFLPVHQCHPWRDVELGLIGYAAADLHSDGDGLRSIEGVGIRNGDNPGVYTARETGRVEADADGQTNALTG